MIFSSVLRFLILYTPMPPSVSNEEHSMMSSDWLRVALLLHVLWHWKKIGTQCVHVCYLKVIVGYDVFSCAL